MPSHVRPSGRSSAALLVSCLLLALRMATARPAAADASTCISAHATAQRESNAGHLRLASRLFTACGSDESCPDPLRKECAEFLQSVTRALPSVIFSVVDERGGDVSDVKVFGGDELLVDGLDGRALAIDPGKYSLRFLLPNGQRLGLDVLVREGEKDRLIQVKGERPASGGERASSEARALGKRAPDAHQGAAPWIAAATAGAAVGTGLTLGLLGTSKKNDLEACKPDCPSSKQSTYDGAKTLFLGADAAFGVALVAAGVATWLFVAPAADSRSPSRSGDGPPSGPAVSFGGGPLRGGAEMMVSGAF